MGPFMKPVETMMRISVASLLLGGFVHLESKTRNKPENPPITLATEVPVPVLTEIPEIELPQVEPISTPQELNIETPKIPEIITYSLNATSPFNKFAGVEIDANGQRLFTRLSQGDIGLGVSPADLPPFGKEWTQDSYTRSILWFNIPNSNRWQPDGEKTFCNILVWDITRALGVEIPHYVDGKETNANWIYKWLTGEGEASGFPGWSGGKGSDVGWFEVTAEEAGKRANLGFPTVEVAENFGTGKRGHVAVVIPGVSAVINGAFYPTIVQVDLAPSLDENSLNDFYLWNSGQIHDGDTGDVAPKYFSIDQKYNLTHNGDGLLLNP